ncbi:MAG: hypothetical protein JW839_12580 [Candidatus Lokiarchaeota archaeon]|nr:hypothetical protein [Candidatus Lokiarchaeota archaeon]
MLLQDIDIVEWLETHPLVIWGGLLGILALNAGLAIITLFIARRADDRHWTFFAVVFHLGLVGFVIYLLRWRKKLQSTTYAGVVLSRVSVGMSIILAFALYGAFPIAAVAWGVVDFIDAWPSIALAVGVCGALFIIGWIGASNRIGALFTFLTSALVVYATWDWMFGDDDGFLVPAFSVLKWALLVVLVVLGFNGLFNFFGMWFTPKNSSRRRWAYADKLKQKGIQHAKALVVGSAAVIALVATGLIAQMPSAYSQTVTITPRDYQARLAFWGRTTYGYYTAAQKAELDEHNATIVFYNTPDIRKSEYNASFINEMKVWRDNYPNVKFIAAIPGVTRIAYTGDELTDFLWGGFAWDGAVEGTVNYAKKFIEIAQYENLTNFVGINTDQESPADVLEAVYGLHTGPNATRHAEAVQMYNDFREWVDTNAPEMFITSTMGNEQFLDMYDGDNDLHVIHRCNVLDVTTWDEIAPMIYRGGYKGEKPYGGFTNVTEGGEETDGSIMVYNKLRILNNSLFAVDGNSDRLGIYLGITNCTCYGRDVDQYDSHGNYLGKGYDSLVRDALIAKHFGAKIITIFILDTVIENGYSMGGVFDTWGDGFLDDFNESINGVNSTRSFTIYADPDFQFMEGMSKDLMYNLGRPAGLSVFLALVGANIAMAILLHPAINARLARATRRGRVEEAGEGGKVEVRD